MTPEAPGVTVLTTGDIATIFGWGAGFAGRKRARKWLRDLDRMQPGVILRTSDKGWIRTSPERLLAALPELRQRVYALLNGTERNR